MDIPRAHTASIKRDHLFLNSGNVTLVFRDNFRFEFPVPVPGNVNLELAILAFKCLGGVSISLVVRVQTAFLFFFIPKCYIQLGFHKLLKNIFKIHATKTYSKACPDSKG